MRMNTHGMKILCFKLKWETFVGHCFGCEWGHFMMECQCHCPSTLEVPNEGNGKEGVGKDVGMSDIVVVKDEGNLLEWVIKRPHFKVLALRIRKLNIWI